MGLFDSRDKEDAPSESQRHLFEMSERTTQHTESYCDDSDSESVTKTNETSKQTIKNDNNDQKTNDFDWDSVDQKNKKNFWLTLGDDSKSHFFNFITSAKYVTSDTIKHAKNFSIGFFTVFLVVFFLSVLQNTIGRSPIIFLKLVEDSVGEYDLFITPLFPNAFALNFTEIDAQLQDVDVVQGSAPRWIASGTLQNFADPNQNTSVTILIFNTTLEAEIDLGRSWSHRPLDLNEMHVSETSLRALGVEANSGEVVLLTIDFFSLAESAGVFGGQSPESFLRDLILQNTNISSSGEQNLDDVLAGLETTLQLLGLAGVNIPATGTNVTVDLDLFVEQILNVAEGALTITQQFLVIDSVGDPGGKFPVALGNVAIIETEQGAALANQALDNIVAILPDPDVLEAILLVSLPNNTDTVEAIVSGLRNATDAIVDFQETFDINHFALSVIALYSNRFDAYVRDIDGLRDEMIEFTNQVSDAIGFNASADFTLPIFIGLQPIQFIRLFLDQIFVFVLVVLIILGALLIYSLMVANVGEKTYEYGMLRALGMRHYSLIEVLFLQSSAFSIPGIGLGLLAGFIVYIPIAFILADIAVAPVDVTISQSAALLAFFVGLLMPLISLLGPVRRALSGTLRDALDIYHQSNSDTVVKVVKLEKLGLSPWQISVSIVLIVVGFIVYYLIPYAFTFQDFTLFFTLLSLILLGMLGGLALMGQTIQGFLEKIFLWLLIWADDRRSLANIVRKNLASHSSRNSKTALMFTLALAFIIFAGTTFTLQANTIAETIRLGNGADIRVELFLLSQDEEAGDTLEGQSLQEEELRNFLSEQSTGEDPLVRGFTFTTIAFQDQEFITGLSLSNLAGFPNIGNFLVGVEPNYLQVTYDEFFQWSEITDQFDYRDTPSGNPDVVFSLFVNAGQQRLPEEGDGIVIPPNILSEPFNSNRSEQETSNAYVNYLDVLVSEALRNELSIDTNTPLRLGATFTVDSETEDLDGEVYLMKPRALIRTFPGFFFSSYRQVAGLQNILISVEQYERISTELYMRGDQTSPPPTPSPKGRLLVRLKENPSQEERDFITNGIRNFINSDFTQVIDVRDLVDSTRLAVDGLVLFFNIVSIIAVVLCFFVLLLSFTANVNENSWQLAVLRAMGLTKFQVTRVYIYEALIIICSSCLLGTTIGLFVSITLTLQFNLFTELPFSFAFPFALFFSVVGMSVILAVLGSWIPVYRFNKTSIANSLKGL